MGQLISLQKIAPHLLALLMTATLATAADRAEVNTGLKQPEAAAAAMLDGKKFTGQTGEKGKKTHHVDTLSFNDGIFVSSECYQFGFTGGPYSAWMNEDTVHFRAVTISPTHGKMEWEGRLEGDTLTVDYSWTKERWLWTTYREYWFEGALAED